MKNAELIADLQSNSVGDPFPLMRKAADAIEALESQRDDLRSQVDSLNVGFNNCQKERDALQAQLVAAQGQIMQWQKKHTLRTNNRWENTDEHDAKWWLENSKGWEIRPLYAAPIPQQPAKPLELTPEQVFDWVDQSRDASVTVRGPWVNPHKLCELAVTWAQQPAPSVPEGWKLVPIEPTEAMRHRLSLSFQIRRAIKAEDALHVAQNLLNALLNYANCESDSSFRPHFDRIVKEARAASSQPKETK